MFSGDNMFGVYKQDFRVEWLKCFETFTVQDLLPQFDCCLTKITNSVSFQCF